MGLASTTALSGEAQRQAIFSLPTLSLLIWSSGEYFCDAALPP